MTLLEIARWEKQAAPDARNRVFWLQRFEQRRMAATMSAVHFDPAADPVDAVKVAHRRAAAPTLALVELLVICDIWPRDLDSVLRP